MNVVLWILQVLLALHTVAGAVWKWTNSEQSVPSIAAIPHGVWLGLSGVELLCAAGLVLPAVLRRQRLAALAAGVIAAEMIFFCVVFLSSGAKTWGEVVYWLVVAAVCAFIAYGRSRPPRPSPAL